ncbi:hypothetical protein DL96DRAFT_1676491 [Flagelloscypha sp. PMI_526]|nr:hypothetical protein DL96DRAFT_1676491 [Flagelloscypha sp. PMI_526]
MAAVGPPVDVSATGTFLSLATSIIPNSALSTDVATVPLSSGAATTTPFSSALSSTTASPPASSTSLSNTPQSSVTPSPKSKVNVGAIAGGVIAGVVIILCLLFLWLFLRRRRQRKEEIEATPARNDLAHADSEATSISTGKPVMAQSHKGHLLDTYAVNAPSSSQISGETSGESNTISWSNPRIREKAEQSLENLRQSQQPQQQRTESRTLATQADYDALLNRVKVLESVLREGSGSGSSGQTAAGMMYALLRMANHTCSFMSGNSGHRFSVRELIQSPRSCFWMHEHGQIIEQGEDN